MTMPEGTPTDDVDTPEGGPADTDTDPKSDPKQNPRNAEAARYRIRAREAEAQRDALAARVEAYQRAEVARLAADLLSNPADLFGVGQVDLSSLLDDEGNVVPELVAEAAASVTGSRPGLAKDYRPAVRATDLSIGLGNGGRGRPAPSFADLLRSDSSVI